MRSRVIALAALLVPGVLTAQAPAGNVAQFDPKEWDVPYGATRVRAIRMPMPRAECGSWARPATTSPTWTAGRGDVQAVRDRLRHQPPQPRRREGEVWFTGNRNNRIVKLDPETGKLTTYMMPDDRARSAHDDLRPEERRRVVHRAGRRRDRPLRPDDGQFRLWKTGERTRPYGIVIDSKGQPWFDLFGTNKIGTIEPKTMEFKTFTLPERCGAPASHRDHVGRPHLLRRLHPRLPRPPRPEDRQDQEWRAAARRTCDAVRDDDG